MPNVINHAPLNHQDQLQTAKLLPKEELYKYTSGIIRDEGGVNLEMGGVEDHVHLLAKFKASVSVSDMLRLIKANSSKWANERMDGEFAWQEGYAAFSVSESQVVPVRRYIRNQVQHHRKQTYQQEFVALLDRHGVEYDLRYLWD
ncbi:MAG: transposase [Pirellulales bacterium]|nr:transposase [Pirellulales bacterium]